MMYMKYIFLLFLFSGLSAVNAVEPLWYFSFDDGKNIDLSTGTTDFGSSEPVTLTGLTSIGKKPLSLKPDQRMDYRQAFAASPWGKSLRIGIDSERRHFYSSQAALPIPLPHHKGSITFWVAPEDWRGNDRDFHVLVSAKGEGAELLIYKYSANSRLYFLMGPEKKASIAAASISSWKPGEWHSIAAVWDEQTMTLYIDGKPAAETERKALPPDDYRSLNIGTRGWKLEKGTSLIDEVKIFSEPVTKDMVLSDFLKQQPLLENRQAPLQFKLKNVSAKVDGVIEPGEYAVSTNISFDPKRQTASMQNQWHLGYDADYFYLGVVSPAPDSEAVFQNKRDGELWLDDGVELYLEHGKQLFQFIVNPALSVYDSKNRESIWNCNGLQKAGRIKDGLWTLELAVPWRELGIQPSPETRFFMNAARTGKSGVAAPLATLAPVLHSYSNQAQFAAVILAPESDRNIWNFKVLPGTGGTLALELNRPDAQQPGTLQVQFTSRGRILMDKNDPLASGATFVEQTGLAKNGRLLLADSSGNRMDLPIVRSTAWSVLYLKADIPSQTLKSVIKLSAPLPPGAIWNQRMLDAEGTTVMNQQFPATNGGVSGQLILAWNLKELPVGLYTYVLSLKTADGTETDSYRQAFRKPSEPSPWDGYSGGQSKTVPHPWRKPQINDSQIICRMQSYRFNRTLLPTAVLAGSENLLAAPATLRLNGDLLPETASFRETAETPLSVSAETREKAGGVNFYCRLKAEYDGLMEFQLEISPESKPVTIHDLSLEIPLTLSASELVSHLLPLSRSQQFSSGRLGSLWKKDLMNHPVFWIGNGDRGLFWGAESLRGTHLRNSAVSLTIRRTADSAVAVIHLVDSPLQLVEPRTICFYLQATPAVPENPRRIPFITSSQMIYSWHRYFNTSDPELLDLDNVRQQALKYRKSGLSTFHYACIYGAAPFGPDWPWFGEYWLASPPQQGQYKVDFPPKDQADRDRNTWAFGCMNNESFRNYSLFYLDQALQRPELMIENLYFDMAYARMCDSVRHGCGWTDDFGVPRRTLNLSGTRDFAKRIRNLLHQKNPKGELMFHVSGEPLPPVCSMADYIVDGEDFVSDLAKREAYYGIFTPERFQTAYAGKKWGNRYAYIPQFGRSARMFNPGRVEYWSQARKAPEAIRAVRHFLGYALLHDTIVFSSLGVWPELSALTEQLKAFGWDEKTVFYPYWSKKPVLQASGGVLISTYVRPNRVLAVLLNDSDQPQTVQVAAADHFPLSENWSVRDAESKEEMAVEKKKFTVTIPVREMRLYKIEETK